MLYLLSIAWWVAQSNTPNLQIQTGHVISLIGVLVAGMLGVFGFILKAFRQIDANNAEQGIIKARLEQLETRRVEARVVEAKILEGLEQIKNTVNLLSERMTVLNNRMTSNKNRNRGGEVGQ